MVFWWYSYLFFTLLRLKNKVFNIDNIYRLPIFCCILYNNLTVIYNLYPYFKPFKVIILTFSHSLQFMHFIQYSHFVLQIWHGRFFTWKSRELFISLASSINLNKWLIENVLQLNFTFPKVPLSKKTKQKINLSVFSLTHKVTLFKLFGYFWQH